MCELSSVGEPLSYAIPPHKQTARKSTWSRLPDLNRRPTDYESVALPTELSRLVRDADPKASRLARIGIANFMARRIAFGTCERHVRKITLRRPTRTAIYTSLFNRSN